MPAEPLPPSKELDAQAHFKRGLLYAQLRQYKNALADFERAGQLNPELRPQDAQGRALRGRTYAAQGQWDKAAADLAKAAELGVPDAESWYWLGRAHGRAGRWEEAVRAYSRAVEIDPTHVDAYQHRGHACEHLGQMDRSVTDHTRAIELWPQNLSPYTCRGRAHAALGHWQQAAEDLARGTQAKDADVSAWFHHALLRLHLGNRKGYRTACAVLLERFGPADNHLTIASVVWVCVLAPDAVADPAAVLQLAEKLAARNDQEKYGYHRTLGAALYRAGRWEDAIRRLDVPGRTRTVDEALYLALAHHRLGRAEEARQWFARAVHCFGQQEQKPAGADAAPFWDRRLALQILRGEAEALIKGPPPGPER